MKSFGEMIRDVIYALYNGVYSFIILCCIIVTLYLVGQLGGDILAYIDAQFLHGYFSVEQWQNIVFYGLISLYALYVLAPAILETIQLVLYGGAALAFIAGLFAFLSKRPFLPIFSNMAVWFFPVVFGWWLLHCMVVKRRGNTRQVVASPYEVTPYE